MAEQDEKTTEANPDGQSGAELAHQLEDIKTPEAATTDQQLAALRQGLAEEAGIPVSAEPAELK